MKAVSVGEAAAAAAEVLTEGADPPPDISVIITVTKRAEDLLALYHEYRRPLQSSGRTVEFLFVTQPCYRSRTAMLTGLQESGAPIHVLEMNQPMGRTALFKAAAAHCRAPIILTLPSYRRVESSFLPRLLERVDQGADLVLARRSPRLDSWLNRLQDRVLNFFVGRLADDRIHDIGSGVRAMRRDLLDKLPLYGDMFRFFPLLALREGFRVDEVAVPQHARDATSRLYRPGVYIGRVVDILGLYFLTRFTEKPLRFFGLVGTVLAASGGAVLVALLVQKLGGEGIADRPLLLLGVLLIVLGVQVFALGLVGEIIVHLHSSRRPPYRLASRTPPLEETSIET